jgi:hypothetical protein
MNFFTKTKCSLMIAASPYVYGMDPSDRTFEPMEHINERSVPYTIDTNERLDTKTGFILGCGPIMGYASVRGCSFDDYIKALEESIAAKNPYCTREDLSDAKFRAHTRNTILEILLNHPNAQIFSWLPQLSKANLEILFTEDIQPQADDILNYFKDYESQEDMEKISALILSWFDERKMILFKYKCEQSS